MAEQENNSIAKEQAKAKPKIEDSINEVLTGEARANALDFVAFLRANKMNPAWSATNAWAANYKGKRVCWVRIHGGADYHGLEPNEWHICFHGEFIGEYADVISADGFKKLADAHIKYCTTCAGYCPRGKAPNPTKFEKICAIWIKNADAEALDWAKKLAEAKMRAIVENKKA